MQPQFLRATNVASWLFRPQLTAWNWRRQPIPQRPWEETFAPSVQSPFRSLLQVINLSKAIIALRDDWDGEGASGYSPTTWRRASRTLIGLAKLAQGQRATILPSPLISPAADGSIDLFWKIEGKTLLMNFPADPTLTPTFFGKSRDGGTVRGTILQNEKRPDLVAWLIP